MNLLFATEGRAGASATLLVLAALATAGLTPAWQQVRISSYDLLSVLSAGLDTDFPVTIVAIDDRSFNSIGVAWPWPRSIHAELVRRLSAANAAVIAFDVMFSEHSEAAEDAALADAIRQSTARVVLAADVRETETRAGPVSVIVEPLKSLREAGAISGYTAVRLDPDRVVRRFPNQTDAFWQQILRSYERRTQQRLNFRVPDPEDLVGYAGPPGTFRRLSYVELLAADSSALAQAFDQQIVLVGLDVSASPELSMTGDRHATPFFPVFGQLMPGVELHANFINAVVSGAVISPLSFVESLLLNGLFLSACAFAIGRWKLLRGAAVVVGICCAAVIVSLLLYQQLRAFFAFSDVLAGAMGIYLIYGVRAYVSEREMRRGIQRIFRHYVSHEVAEQLMAQPEELKLGGERRRITLMFCDLANFTALSERLDAEATVQILNEYTSAMGGIITANKGTIDKFMGDGIMAFWGAPLSDPEQELNACRAAREMQQAMADLSARYSMKGWLPLILRIGIHSGDAIVGNVGSQEQFAYTAVGDTVNLASRLEGVNKQYDTRILLSENTAWHVKDKLGLRWLDRIRVKGKSQPVDIYTLCDNERLNNLTRVAIDAYRQRDWEASEAAWRDLLALEPNDPLAALYLERIEQFRRTAPPPDWDAAVSIATK